MGYTSYVQGGQAFNTLQFWELCPSNSWTRPFTIHRTRRDRLAQVHANWSLFLTELADAYIAWKATSSLSESPPSESHGDNMSTPQPSSPSSSGSTPDSYDFNITTIDIYTLQRNRNIHRTSEMKTAVALMSHGLLSNVPLLPSIALSLSYRRHYQTQLRRRFFLFDKQQDCREPTLEREEEECKEEAVLSKKKQPEIWGFSQAMPWDTCI